MQKEIKDDVTKENNKVFDFSCEPNWLRLSKQIYISSKTISTIFLKIFLTNY